MSPRIEPIYVPKAFWEAIEAEDNRLRERSRQFYAAMDDSLLNHGSKLHFTVEPWQKRGRARRS